MFTFWQLAGEEPAFIHKVSELEPVVALPSVRASSRSELVPLPVREYLTVVAASSCLLVPERLVSSVDIDATEFSQGVMFGVSAMQAPVIGYERGRLADRRLALSNLYAYLTHLDGGAETPKSEEFRGWCNKVFGLARRYASEKHGSYRATIGVLEALAAGTIELVDY